MDTAYNSMLKVSVIIPAFNTEKYIEQSIRSALSQTLENIEVIVVDDCSTDNTVKVVQGISDPRLKLLRSSQNRGAGATRNIALKVAQGKWVAVLDSDDWYAPERLETLVRIAEQKGSDLIADDLYLIEDNTSSPWGTMIRQSKKKISSVQRVRAVDFVLGSIEGKSTLSLGFTKPLFKRNFLVEHQIEYDASITVSQDFWFDMQCFLHGATFTLVPQPYYFYRSRFDSLVNSDKIKRLKEECLAIRDFLQYENYLEQNPQVLRAMQLKRKETEKWFDYYCAIRPIKQGRLFVGLKLICSDFKVLRHLISQVPKIAQRILKYKSFSKRVGYQKSIFSNN